MLPAATAGYPVARQERFVLGTLLVLGAAAWAALGWQGTMADTGEMSPTMGMGAPIFLAVWVVMMVAMMFPTAAPMILTFARVQAARRQRGQGFIPTWLFVLAYLLVWTGFGALAFGIASLSTDVADRSPWLMDNATRIGGLLLLAAGLYQLTPLKRACLLKCRTPMDFVLGRWREGYRGALRMGVEHGVYCLGCCWLLFVILFPLGVMNVALMALVTVLIFVEKSLPHGPLIGKVVAIGLMVCGAIVVVGPSALPIMPMTM